MAIDLDSLRSNYEKSQPKRVPKNQKKKPGGVKGFLTSLIGEAGGTGGALAGAGTGAALGSVVPGIGTAIGGVIGAGIGGLAGGTGGQLVENKVRDDKFDVGKALKHGAVEGIMGAGPLRLLKGGSAATNALIRGKTLPGLKGAIESNIPMSGVDDIVSSSRKIPVSFLDDISTPSPLSSSKISPKGIPIKYSGSEVSGKGVPVTKNKLLVDPKISQLEDELQDLTQGGFSIGSKTSKGRGRKSFKGRGTTVFEPSDPISRVQLKGSKTNVPLLESFGKSEIIPAKNQTAIGYKASVGGQDKYTKSTQSVENPEKIDFSVKPPDSRRAAIKNDVEEAITTSLLSKIPGAKKLGTAMSAGASGLKPGKEIGALENVDKTARTLANLGIKGTPKNQAKQIQNKMGELGKEVDNVLLKNQIPLSGSMVTQRLADAMADPANARFIDINLESQPVKKLIEQYGKKLNDVSDAKGLNDFIKTINKTATQAEDKLRNPTARALTSKEEALLAIKRAGDDVLGEVEEIKPLKQRMATLYSANPDVVAASQKSIGLPMTSGVGARAPVQQSKGVISRVGANLQGAPQAPITPQGILGRTLGTNAVGAGIATQDEQQQALGQEEDLLAQGADMDMTGMEDLLSQEEADTSPFAASNLETNVQNILSQGGTMKDVKDFLDIATTMQSLSGTSGSSKPLSGESAKVQANASSGLKSLSQLQGMIDQGGVPKGTLLPGRDLLGGAVGSAAGTTAYDAAAKNIADVITRLRTGAALTASEEKFYKSQLPSAFDPPETIQQKLGMFRDLFSSIGNSTSGGTDLDSLLRGGL